MIGLDIKVQNNLGRDRSLTEVSSGTRPEPAFPNVWIRVHAQANILCSVDVPRIAIIILEVIEALSGTRTVVPAPWRPGTVPGMRDSADLENGQNSLEKLDSRRTELSERSRGA